MILTQFPPRLVSCDDDNEGGAALMAYGIKLQVWGERACFTRPEMKVERVSYDVMTPSAARGILEAIHWKPAIRWIIDRLHVLKPIKFESLRRNEVKDVISERNVKTAMQKRSLDGLTLLVEDSRTQRASTVLRDVSYIIEAHFEMTLKAGTDDNEAKHIDTFKRRAKRGQCFHTPCLGTREFPANFEFLEGDLPKSELVGEKYLGYMLHDLDFSDKKDIKPKFFQAKMIDGIIEVPHFDEKEVRG